MESLIVHLICVSFFILFSFYIFCDIKKRKREKMEMKKQNEMYKEVVKSFGPLNENLDKLGEIILKTKEGKMTKAIFVFYREYFEKKLSLEKSIQEGSFKHTTSKIITSPHFDSLKYQNVETKVLKIGSLFPNEEFYREVGLHFNPKLYLDSLLEENSKKEEPDDFFVMAYGKQEIDEEIWRQVSLFSQNVIMLHETEKGFVKVTGIRKSYFEGEEVIFLNKKEKQLTPEEIKEIEKAEDGFRELNRNAPEVIIPQRKGVPK